MWQVLLYYASMQRSDVASHVACNALRSLAINFQYKIHEDYTHLVPLISAEIRTMNADERITTLKEDTTTGLGSTGKVNRDLIKLHTPRPTEYTVHVRKITRILQHMQTCKIYSVCAVSTVSNSCSLPVSIAVSVVVCLLIGALTYVAGLLCSGMCISKRRFKTAADTGQLPPPSSVEVSENSSKTAAVYEEIDLHQVKPTDIQLTENAAYGEFK